LAKLGKKSARQCVKRISQLYKRLTSRACESAVCFGGGRGFGGTHDSTCSVSV